VATLSGHPLGQLNDGDGNSGSEVFYFSGGPSPMPIPIPLFINPRTVASTNNNFNFAYRARSVNSNFVTSEPQDEGRPKDRIGSMAGDSEHKQFSHTLHSEQREWHCRRVAKN